MKNIKNKGFTLMELMIVVAIIVILSAAAIPALGERYEKNAIIKVREEISDFLKTSVEKAYEEGRGLSIDIDPTINRITATRTGATTSVIGRPLEIPSSLKIYTVKDIEPKTESGKTYIELTGDENTALVSIAVNSKGTIELIEGGTKYDSLVIVAKTRKSETPVAVRLSNVAGVDYGRVEVYLGSGDKKLFLRQGK